MINCPYYFDKATTRRWEHKNFVLDEIERVDIYQYPSFFSRSFQEEQKFALLKMAVECNCSTIVFLRMMYFFRKQF